MPVSSANKTHTARNIMEANCKLCESKDASRELKNPPKLTSNKVDQE